MHISYANCVWVFVNDRGDMFSFTNCELLCIVNMKSHNMQKNTTKYLHGQ